MSLNMYLGEVQGQTQSMNAVCIATIQGMEQVIQSIDAFAVDTVLQGQTYSSAKAFFVQTFRPLAQGIIYLCEELIRQNDAFPSQFQSQVASTDVIEQELLEQIREIDRMKTSMEAINQAMPIPGMDAMANLFTVMRKKLQEKLEHLYEFNYTSSSNYDTALQLAASIATGLAEVQSGKGFSPASGTFSTQGLNMEWTTSIQAIGEERARQVANSIEEGAMCGKPPEKSTFRKVVDGTIEGAGQAVEDTIEGFKALGKWETWENMGNAALHPIDTLSTMYNVLSDSFINDVINGDAESRAKWGSYALTQVGLGLIGDKGLSKASKLGQAGKVTKLAKNEIPQTFSHITSNLQMGDRFAFAGMGTFKNELPKVEDLFVYASREKSKGLNDNINQTFGVKKIEGKNSHESRGASLKEIKRQLNIPRFQHPISQKMVPLTDSNGKRILNDNKQPIMTRELTYEVKGQKIIIQDHSEGHKFGEGGIGDQPPHHNVRPEYNTRTGQVDGMEDHYYFEKRNKK
ncbi:HNH/endonuclease VII fold putative polymorphic toxin [Bacillus toyonensis]|uniref:HNH/endonuclease VII fold putative polymorphic toxin n=1 Tax=Bacillus cereus group TaxID=86661 RepID=UPI000991B2DC|nr:MULTISPECIES: HNH/endonuclease VII fold putative polymorphic toxin [Bacillus cereus group]MCU4770605.1 HNH/endonuclease VII fold putative polymorphic toxin [Bacillus toyonensis]MCU5583716.1 HNH/endonuclease VII fold putative polymorphic toxin [Bacillus toyonensis]OOR68927.1 cytoplasmic protein [Bacillus mycoides]QWG65803.1 cytoplasmic protein [Bacillus mycoides]